jgi:hypothetical protein
MPQEIQAFRAEDGSIHEDACDAASRDIQLLVEGSPLAENKPFARDLVRWLMSDPENIALRLTEFRQSCPNGANAEARSETSERTRSSERTLADGE